MSFQTERPKSAGEMLEELAKKRETRVKNLKALQENATIDRNAEQAQSVLESSQIQQQKAEATAERLDAIKQRRANQQSVYESTIGKVSLLEQAKATVMNKVIFEMVYDAYWLDSDVKQATVQESYDNYRDLISTVEQVCGASKTPNAQKTAFIKAVEEAVSDVCTKAVDRIITEAKATGETNIEFNLTTEEESELDNKLSELGRDDIVNLVKEKVLTVVQDERESGKEKASILQELNSTDDEPDDTQDENELPDNTEEPDDSGVEESAAYSSAITNDTIVPVSEGIIQSIKNNKQLRKEASALLTSVGSSLSFKEEGKLFNEGLKACHKKQYDDAIKKYNDYIKAMTSLKKKIAAAKGDYSPRVKNMLQNSCDVEISITKQYIETARNGKPQPSAVKESYEPVTEIAALTVAVSTAILGVVIAGVALSVKDKIELKKALTVYEKNCKPMVKMSQLTPTLYELDGAHRATNTELSGLKKFLNKNSKRAKVWKDDKGHVVCTAILYTTTSVTPGIQASSDGISPTINVEKTAHYSYHVEDKYKKDGLYLSAYMAFSDGYNTDNSRALTVDMKKSFGDEMKSTKVKLIGKSLESVSAIAHISPAFVEYEAACELLEECGVSGTGAEATYLCAMNETDPQKAIKLFSEYKDILQQATTSILIAPADKYSHKVKTAVGNAISEEQKMCDENINAITKRMETNVVKSPEDIMTSLKQQRIKRIMNRTGAGTLFESMMIANAKKTMDAAVTEGITIQQEDTMNAALIESILQYTVLETLNTIQLYKFTDNDVRLLKAMNKPPIK